MTDDKDQRTESATPKRISEAREKGDVAKSKDITSVAVFVAGRGAIFGNSLFVGFAFEKWPMKD